MHLAQVHQKLRVNTFLLQKKCCEAIPINYLKQLITLFSYEKPSLHNAMTKGFPDRSVAQLIFKKEKQVGMPAILVAFLPEKRPFWFQTFYKPGGRIAAYERLEQKAKRNS